MVASSQGSPPRGRRDRPSPPALPPPRSCLEGGGRKGLLVPLEESGDAVDHAQKGVPDPAIPVGEQVEAVIARESDSHIAEHLAAKEGRIKAADRHRSSAGGDSGDIKQRSWSEGHGEDGKECSALDPPFYSAVDRATFQHPATAKARRVSCKLAKRLSEAGHQADGYGRRYSRNRVEKATCSEDDAAAGHWHDDGGRAKEHDPEKAGVTPTLELVLAEVESDKERPEAQRKQQHAHEKEILEPDAPPAEVDEQPLALDFDWVVFVLEGLDRHAKRQSIGCLGWCLRIGVSGFDLPFSVIARP